MYKMHFFHKYSLLRKILSTEVRKHYSNFRTKTDNLSTLKRLRKYVLSFMFIFNMKIHRLKGSGERFDDILKISGGFSVQFL